MATDGSVTGFVALVRAGDPEGAQQLWQRYFRRLVGLARKKLQDAPRRAADEEDVALSAFDSFCRNAEQGRFPQLLDRDGLWRLLVVLTARKASHLLRDQRRQKRAAGDMDEESVLDQVLSREPTPELAAQVAEECRRLLAALGDPKLEALALWRMEGYTVEEIAEKVGSVARSVRRKLQMIRGIWEEEVAS
jgi:RNA polymerase sigma factor (sigma-70 family)